jgi:pyruvate/2-oxoacid:ferredoxin oxidoreductase alpha subunit
MSNKNPFEIRFDTLSMAKEMLDREMDLQQEVFYHQLEFAKENSRDITETIEKYQPKMYKPHEISAKAEELYKFITKKD